MKPEMQKIKHKWRARQMAVFAMLFLPSLLVFVILWQLPSAPAQDQARSSLPVRSLSFSDGGSIPQRFTCDGDGDSPNLQWPVAPAATKSVAIVMNDPDAPVDFTHWLVYNIPPGVRGLAEGASQQADAPRFGRGDQ